MSSSSPDPSTALAQFRTHFLEIEGFIHPSLELIYTPHAGVTLRVKENHVGVFPKGEVAISCPHWASLSALNAGCVDGARDWWRGAGDGDEGGVEGDGGASEPGALGGDDREDEGEDGRGEERKRTKLLELPAEIRRQARPQFVAAVWIAVQYRLGEESPWARYFDILPGLPDFVPEEKQQGNDAAHEHQQDVPSIALVPRAKRGLGKLDTPLWWDNKDRGWLQNTNLAKGIADLEGVWIQEWKRWESVVGAWGEVTGVHVTWHLTKYALTLLGSRAFSSAQTISHLRTTSGKPLLDVYNPDMLLYPGVDSLNHNPLTQNSWKSDEEGFGIVVGDELAAGMEVWNPYGGKSNGELLLSYGFCIENNPCDSFAVRLPPTPPSLLQLVQQAHENCPLSALSSESPTTHSHLQPQPLSTTTISTTTMPLTSHNRPPAHNLAHNTFFIRHRSRHTCDEPDYPLPSPNSSTTTPATRTAALTVALAGFPTLLLSTLAATLVTPYEANLVSTHPEHFSASTLYTQLGKRNTIALINLLAQRLRVELSRLPLPLPIALRANEAGDAEESTTRQLRKHWTNIYLSSQREILVSNIEVLEAGLVSALLPDSADGVPGLLTLSTAFELLGVLDQKVCEAALGDIAVVYGVEYSGSGSTDRGHKQREFGTGNADTAAFVNQLRELEVEEDVWVIWIGLVVFVLQSRDGRSDEDGATGKVVERLREWSTFLSSAYGVVVSDVGEEMDVDNDDEDDDEEGGEDIATHILSVLAALRNNSATTSPSRNLWNKNSWTRHFITAFASVVQSETINLRVQADSALSKIEGVQGNSVALVGLYVGREMRSV